MTNHGPHFPAQTVIYYENEIPHCDDGPAYVFSDGCIIYCKHGQWHRNDGPANTHPDGTCLYYVDGKPHRDDGPALSYPDGQTFYYRFGKLHRDGYLPAVPHSNSFYKNGKQYTLDELHTHGRTILRIMRCALLRSRVRRMIRTREIQEVIFAASRIYFPGLARLIESYQA